MQVLQVMLDMLFLPCCYPFMPDGFSNGKRLPCRQAGEAFFVSARGSSRGQGRGDYTPETSVRTRLLAPSALVGPSLLEAAASPCPQPRDCAPWCQTVRNIATFGLLRHGASLNVTDCAREHSPPRQAN